MSHQPMSPGLDEFIFSRESGDGSTRSTSRAGQQTGPFGPGAARANHSPRRGRVGEKPTSGTSGQKCSGSSASAALTQQLANKLQQQLRTTGLMEYSQTWRQKVTPAGRLYWAHIASVPRTSGSVFSGWPTSTAGDSKEVSANMGERQRSSLPRAAAWASPSSRDWKDTGPVKPHNESGTVQGERLDQLGRQAYLAPIGTAAIMSFAATGKSAALNPAFSLWLMGFHSCWLMAAPVQASRARKRSTG